MIKISRGGKSITLSLSPSSWFSKIEYPEAVSVWGLASFYFFTDLYISLLSEATMGVLGSTRLFLVFCGWLLVTCMILDAPKVLQDLIMGGESDE